MTGTVSSADPAATRIDFDNGERFLTTLPPDFLRQGERVNVEFGADRSYRLTVIERAS